MFRNNRSIRDRMEIKNMHKQCPGLMSRSCTQCKKPVDTLRESFVSCFNCYRVDHHSCVKENNNSDTICECGMERFKTVAVCAPPRTKDKQQPKWGTVRHGLDFMLWIMSPYTVLSGFKLVFYCHLVYLILGFAGKVMAFSSYLRDNDVRVDGLLQFLSMVVGHEYDYRWSTWNKIEKGGFADMGPVHFYHALICGSTLMVVAVMYYIVACIGNKLMARVRRTPKS